MSKAITLDGETADRICQESLGQHIEIIKADIKRLTKAKSLQNFEKEDLGHNVSMLASMKDVYEYYGGKE